MAKKATKKEPVEKKKRKSTASPALPPPEEKEGEASQSLGSVSIPVQTTIRLTAPGTFDELVIEWGCLGLSEEPDSIAETSGNSRLLDPKRPPTTDDEGLHVYFEPPLSGAGNYGFQFMFTYNEAVNARTKSPEAEGDEHEEAA